MEVNFISEYQATGFYVNLESKTYGVCINIKDVDRAQEIINYFKKTRKQQIEAWKQEWGVVKI
jgi:hypothetical protein